ncbi:hypothetical protein HDG34_003210 [Paraburkholderia sp. HC6.4b]|uniref:DUF7941 domain-family protein n=1 Tax=unclassified Paraburkholderia TaxID=2615204 RepID=UPI00161591D4|nr:MULTISPECIES: hypothetical protein [unclassified Paraburkholderia]MBB5409269.1 hypothetical protein [Paraburkholderia sp. HC6.4b]MBB5450997.1 hypothetical protein [Paraburkholderia sp. Kb1A]
MKPPYSIYHRTSPQILRDLVYFTSGFLLPEQGVIYGKPVAKKPVHGDTIKRDTVIEIGIERGGACSQRIRGRRSFWYRRIDLGLLDPPEAGHEPIPITAYPFDTYNILPAINEYYGLKLGQNDVENRVCGPTDVAYLVASSGSLAFSGCKELQLTLPDIASLVDTASIGEFEAAA